MALFCLLAPSYAATPIGSDPGGGGVGGNAASAPGPSFPWVGSVDDTGTGNKLISVPIVSWAQRGGLPVDLTLNQNSQSTVSGELGPKWLISYDDTLSVDASGNVTVHWGDGRVYAFAKKTDGTYTPPPGIYDTLVYNSGTAGNRILGPPSYSLTTKDQVHFGFKVLSQSQSLLSSISDENGNYINIGYVSGTNLVQTITDTTGRAITLAYANSKLTSVTDPLSHQWTLSYDGSGNLAHVSWPVLNGATSSVNLGYDGSHDLTSYQDRRGNTSTLSYNSDASLAWEKDAVGNQTTFSYGTPSIHATTITDPNGHSIVHYYGNGQLLEVADALGNAEYDTWNSYTLTQKQDRRGYQWNYTYDSMGNVLTAKDPYGNTTTYTYNAHNKPLTITLPLGRSVAGTYDALDNLTQVQQKDAAGNIAATTSFTIGNYGLVSDKYDPNNHHTSYTYDANSNLASTTTPLGHKTQWTYDALGFQTSRIDAMSRTTNYTPDAWERLVTTTYPDNSTNSYGYDPNGNLTAFANYVGSYTRSFDPDNRMLNEYYNGIRDDTHTYDAAGQKGLLSSVTDYDGRVISYTYSARNELAGVSDSVGGATYAYDANGNQSHLYNTNGTRTDQYYNADGTASAYYNWNGGSTVFSSYGYGYNADHQITGLNEGTTTNTDTMPGPTQTTYGYDALGHLNTESRTGSNPFSVTYTVDGANNRTNYQNPGSNPYLYDGDDELKSCGGVNTFGFGYNANGDRTSETFNGQGTTFTYDFDDQLLSITKPGTTASYQYDALGRQVNKTVNGVVTGHYLDGGQILIEKVNGVKTAQYEWGNGLIRCNGEYPLTDGRGNARQTTSASQTVTSGNQPDAFGVNSVTSGTASSYAYGASSGYREDGIGPAGLSSAFGFQKVGARYYDPTVGAFLSRDTDLSQSPYAYCDGDPVNFSDPSGHKTRPKKPTQPTSGGGAPSSGGSGSSGPSGGSGGGTSTGGNSGGTSGGSPKTTDEQKAAAGFVGTVVGGAVKIVIKAPGLGNLAGAAAGAAAGYLTLKIEENGPTILRELGNTFQNTPPEAW